MLLASAADAFGGSSGILGFVLGGGLLTAVIGGYRFFVNFRVTERGMARDRVAQAVHAEQAERRARQRIAREASLWQSRCADLEYMLRTNGVAPPPMNSELYSLALSSSSNSIEESGTDDPDSEDDKRRPRNHRRLRRPVRVNDQDGDDEDREDRDVFSAIDERLRHEESDERGGYRSLFRSRNDRGEGEQDDEDSKTSNDEKKGSQP